MNAPASEMTTTALVNYYGSDRMMARQYAAELDGCNWVGVPFAGGMSIIPYLKARQLLVNDKHRHVINLARVAAHPTLGPKLYRHLRRLPFHPVTLLAAQSRCIERERGNGEANFFGVPIAVKESGLPDLEWAIDYFVASWMNRGGKGGKRDEFKGGLPIRYNAGGGGSAVRYYSAASSLRAWFRTLWRCEFTTDDVFEFLSAIGDVEGNGLYGDAPFPGPGDFYKHQLPAGEGLGGQERLALAFNQFRHTRVCLRFYDVPLIRKLYPEGTGPGRWTYVCRTGRTQANGEAAEILLINGASRAGRAA